MMTRCAVVFGALTVVGLLVAPPSRAQSTPAAFEVSGTSTVRGWTCPVDGTVETVPGQDADPVPGLPGGLEAVTVTVRVAEFRCPEEEMNEHLREAMEASAHPEIVFELERYAVTGAAAEATGTLMIHGVTRPLTLALELTESPEGVRAVGETDIDMTAFGVTPPSVFFGLLTVGEVVTVTLETRLPSSE